MARRLPVFLTFDTEVWPHSPSWKEEALAQDIQRDIFGRTARGEFGLRFQLDLLDSHRLKGVFFVEPLFGSVAGPTALRDIVALIQDRGHDVQLHGHSEWLQWMDDSPLPGRRGVYLKDFTVDEQAVLIGQAKRILEQSGAAPVKAFRAGNFGANNDTLAALRKIGIGIDSSHNILFLGRGCAVSAPEPLFQPLLLDGVFEFPVSSFADWPGHFRPAQLCGISSAEMETALLAAARSSWTCFVIVLHTFELLVRDRHYHSNPRHCPTVVERFERLCRFLESHSDLFYTATFGDLDPASLAGASSPAPPLRGTLLNTAMRFGEQAWRRI